MMETITNRRVVRIFKGRGLILQAAALEGILSVLKRESNKENNDAETVLTFIVERCKELCSQSSPLVTVDLLASVVADLSRNANDVNEEAMQLLNAFETPRLHFDAMRKQFALKVHEERSLFGQATDKVDMFAQRFALVQQRILKQDVFRPKLVSSDNRQSSTDGRHVTHTLTQIESLLGRAGVRFMLGMIVQVEEGIFYLEDNTAQVPIDVSEAEILTDGFFTENCIVLVEGEMIDGVLQVHRMGNPIVETRGEAIKDIGLLATDIFQSISTLAELEDIQQQELIHGQDGMLVILSNVHLDKPKVMDKLRTMFLGFHQVNPVYIFMGNFMSSISSTKEWIGYFEELCNLIGDIDGLAQEGRFIFVPGPQDPGLNEIFPRPPLPKFCTQSMRQRVQHASFATNPCRIRYFSKEIVLYRNNVTFQLQRSALISPRESGSTSVQHTVKTLLDQGHLCPYPRPLYWQFDHSMRLYPLPDALIMGERLGQYYENYAECDVINPGTFSSDFGFVVYRPIATTDGTTTTSDVEFSQIPS